MLGERSRTGVRVKWTRASRPVTARGSGLPTAGASLPTPEGLLCPGLAFGKACLVSHALDVIASFPNIADEEWLLCCSYPAIAIVERCP